MATSPDSLLAMTPPGYTFPDSRLRRELDNPKRDPLILVACGSFSPVHYVHLRESSPNSFRHAWSGVTFCLVLVLAAVVRRHELGRSVPH